MASLSRSRQAPVARIGPLAWRGSCAPLRALPKRASRRALLPPRQRAEGCRSRGQARRPSSAVNPAPTSPSFSLPSKLGGFFSHRHLGDPPPPPPPSSQRPTAGRPDAAAASSLEDAENRCARLRAFLRLRTPRRTRARTTTAPSGHGDVSGSPPPPPPHTQTEARHCKWGVGDQAAMRKERWKPRRGRLTRSVGNASSGWLAAAAAAAG